jgi:hypothetical protein
VAEDGVVDIELTGSNPEGLATTRASMRLSLAPDA